MIMNEGLLEKQKVSKEAEELMYPAYNYLFMNIVNGKEFTTSKEDTGGLTPFQRMHTVRMCEFNLQGLWNFSKDEDFHSYWFTTIGCKCPKHDNHERVGTNTRIISISCKLHHSSNYPEKRIAIAELQELRLRTKSKLENYHLSRYKSTYINDTCKFLQYAIEYYSIEIKKLGKLSTKIRN